MARTGRPREGGALSPTSRTGASRCPASAIPTPRVLLIGLAPAAHGGNRTGRVFTGDRSGDFLWSALHATGFADRASSRRADDGLTLDGAIAAAVRCAPPLNRPTNEERDTCAPFLVRELALLDSVRVIVPLGGFGWDVALARRPRVGIPVARPRPRASATGGGHRGALSARGLVPPSQQNTFTGKLTPAMFEAILWRARDLAAWPCSRG